MVYTNIPDIEKARDTLVEGLREIGVIIDLNLNYDDLARRIFIEIKKDLDSVGMEQLLTRENQPSYSDRVKIDLLVYSTLPFMQAPEARCCQLRRDEMQLDLGLDRAIQTRHRWRLFILEHTLDGTKSYLEGYHYGELGMKMDGSLAIFDFKITSGLACFAPEPYGGVTPKSLHLFEEVYQIGVSVGDLMHAGFSVANTTSTALMSGMSIQKLRPYCRSQRKQGQNRLC